MSNFSVSNLQRMVCSSLAEPGLLIAPLVIVEGSTASRACYTPKTQADSPTPHRKSESEGPSATVQSNLLTVGMGKLSPKGGGGTSSRCLTNQGQIRTRTQIPLLL